MNKVENIILYKYYKDGLSNKLSIIAILFISRDFDGEVILSFCLLVNNNKSYGKKSNNSNISNF